MDTRDAPHRGAYRAGYTQYNPYRTVDRRHVCRNGRLEHGRRRGGSHPSVWDEPISDYKTAVKQGISELEQRYAYAMEHSSDSTNYNASKIRKLMAKLKEIKRLYLEPKQLSLFDVA